MSKQWSSFTAEEKEVWKVKASETSAWTEVPKKKLVRDLTSAIDENVSGVRRCNIGAIDLLL